MIVELRFLLFATIWQSCNSFAIYFCSSFGVYLDVQRSAAQPRRFDAAFAGKPRRRRRSTNTATTWRTQFKNSTGFASGDRRMAVQHYYCTSSRRYCTVHAGYGRESWRFHMTCLQRHNSVQLRDGDYGC